MSFDIWLVIWHLTMTFDIWLCHLAFGYVIWHLTSHLKFWLRHLKLTHKIKSIRVLNDVLGILSPISLTSLLMGWALAVSLKMSTSQRTPNTVQNFKKINNYKLIDLLMRIELTPANLMIPFSDFLRNSTINFLMFLYLVLCFLRVTVYLLCRSQGRAISSPITN